MFPFGGESSLIVIVAETNWSMGSRFLRDVTLLVAFEHVGERLFGDAWQGFEHQYAQEPPPQPPEDIAARARRLVGEEDRLKSLSSATYAARALCLDDALRPSFDAILARINDAIGKVVSESRAIEQNTSAATRFADFERYQQAWGLLQAALASERLTARVDAQGHVSPHAWKDAAFGKVDLRLSILRQPEECAAGLVTINAKEFERWLLAIPTATNAPFDVEAWCREKILERRRSMNPPRSQEALFQELQAEQASLTRSKFDAAWKTHAPLSWKSPGRKSGKTTAKPRRKKPD